MILHKMKIRLGAFLILIVIQLIFAIPSFSLKLNTRDEYLFDTRGDDGDIYRSCITLEEKLESPSMELSVFLESQWNLLGREQKLLKN